MKNLETIEGCLSVEELGVALKRHAELMVDNSTDGFVNRLRLEGMRALCDLYEKYNNRLIKHN